MKTDNSRIDLCVVIPVARMDWHLAKKMLTWWARLLNGQPNPFVTCVLCSKELTTEQRDQLGDSGLPNLCIVVAESVEEVGYFGAANAMFKAALDWWGRELPRHAMLWVEADCVPLRAAWVEAIQAEYRRCGQPFMGDHVVAGQRIPHMTGNAVYHPDWKIHAPGFALLPGPVRAWGWDSQFAHQTFTQSHKADTIQQIWRPELPITAAFLPELRGATTLFHQCKDGSLIDVLCSLHGIPQIPLDVQLVKSTYEADRGKHGQEDNTGTVWPKMRSIAERKANPVTEILIVTFRRDIEFLRYCLKAIEKFASGFGNVTVAVPIHEKGLYDWMPSFVRTEFFEEPAGKGMMAHEREILRADELCQGADIIVHLDADCILWEPTTPKDFMIDGNPVIVREAFAKIGNPNRHIWKKCVDAAIGWEPEFETMTRHPQVYRRELYAKTRQLIEKKCGKSFESYVMACRNEFPQSFAEHPTLGAVALKHFPDDYTFVDYDRESDKRELGIDHNDFQYVYRHGRDKLVECWTHGGVDRYRTLLDSVLNNTSPQFVLK